MRITAVGPQQAIDLMLDSAHGESRGVHLCNAYTLSLAMRSEEVRGLLNRAALNFADGHPVALIGRRAGHASMTERVYGPDLMLATLDRGRARGLRHYLYGATAQTLEALVQRVHERFPGVVIVGEEAPPFRELNDIEIAQMRERIVTAAPDVVWVGLGTPRQDEFVGKHADSLAATVVGVGAAFDFLAGAKRQAPLWMQRHGLEWAFRLATEPRRLWKRYVIGLPVFAAGALRDLRRQRRRGRT